MKGSGGSRRQSWFCGAFGCSPPAPRTAPCAAPPAPPAPRGPRGSRCHSVISLPQPPAAPRSDNDMAINGNDLPSSPADKHALQAAASMSELLALNKLGLMYTTRGVYTARFIPSIPVAAEPLLLRGWAGALTSSLTSCGDTAALGSSCHRGDKGHISTPCGSGPKGWSPCAEHTSAMGREPEPKQLRLVIPSSYSQPLQAKHLHSL